MLLGMAALSIDYYEKMKLLQDRKHNQYVFLVEKL